MPCVRGFLVCDGRSLHPFPPWGPRNALERYSYMTSHLRSASVHVFGRGVLKETCPLPRAGTVASVLKQSTLLLAHLAASFAYPIDAFRGAWKSRRT